jgi:hypothetical protein
MAESSFALLSLHCLCLKYLLSNKVTYLYLTLKQAFRLERKFLIILQFMKRLVIWLLIQDPCIIFLYKMGEEDLHYVDLLETITVEFKMQWISTF